MADAQRHLVIFQPSGSRGYIEEGKTLKEASRELGVDLETICGEKTTCGKCKVRIEEGYFEREGIRSQMEHLSPVEGRERKFFDRHENLSGHRLACVARVYGDVLVFVPEESRVSRQIVRKSASERAIHIKPAIRKFYIEMPPPTLEDPLGDWERMTAALEDNFGLTGLKISYPTLLGLQETLRESDFAVTVTVWMGEEVIKVEPGFAEKSYGLAVDIGTTTVAGYLCELDSGAVVATESMMNPQVSYGEDVMSRITYAMMNDDGLEKMHRTILEGLNTIAERIAAQAGLEPTDIVEAVLVGNTAMHHILLGIYPEHVGVSPFAPALHAPVDVKAGVLGLAILPTANVHILPIEAGFVGADNVGVLLAEEPYNQDDNLLIIDIGTNGELILGSRQELLSCSCATGPAFEGAHIKFGMRAAPGAIEKVRISPATKEASFKVIGQAGWSSLDGEVKAKGLCGSGIIDVVAEMIKAGIVEKSGRFSKTVESPRVRRSEGGQPEYVVAWAEQTTIGRDITISQKDVRAVQLAKGAMYAGAKALLRKLGVDLPDKVVLAGAFGSYIDKKRALALGLFPDCGLENVYAVGNAAGDGARIALLNVDKRQEAARMARQVEYIELTVDPAFQMDFAQAMHFPHMKDKFPNVRQFFKVFSTP